MKENLDAALRDANLNGALHMDGNLNRADLCGANLREALVTSAQLGKAQPLDDCLSRELHRCSEQTGSFYAQ
ncbi:MAG: pentapeptide repeat-containing protein [Ktedonobacteraceae bacterium]